MVVAFIQTKEMTEGHIRNVYPILGILFVDFLNFYNSIELLNVVISPKLPNDFTPRCVVTHRDSLVSFIQIRGNFNKIHLFIIIMFHV